MGIFKNIYMPKSLSTIKLVTNLGFAYHVKHSKKIEKQLISMNILTTRNLCIFTNVKSI
jgi:hypothetical protein